MSNVRKRRSKFIKTSTNGNSSRSERPEPLRSPDAAWYRGMTEIPLSKFIKVAVDFDLHQLIIYGNPSEVDLTSAWGVIYQEFLDGMQDGKSQRKVKLMNEVDRLDYDYRVVQLCVQRLGLGPSQWAIEQLKRRVRVAGDFNPEDQAQYFQQLVVVMNQALSMKQRLIERQAELKIIYQREAGGGALTYQHFDSLIARVCLFAKFQINRNETKVSEFVEYYKEMKRQEQALRDQLETHKARR